MLTPVEHLGFTRRLAAKQRRTLPIARPFSFCVVGQASMHLQRRCLTYFKSRSYLHFYLYSSYNENHPVNQQPTQIIIVVAMSNISLSLVSPSSFEDYPCTHDITDPCYPVSPSNIPASTSSAQTRAGREDLTWTSHHEIIRNSFSS